MTKSDCHSVYRTRLVSMLTLTNPEKIIKSDKLARLSLRGSRVIMNLYPLDMRFKKLPNRTSIMNIEIYNKTVPLIRIALVVNTLMVSVNGTMGQAHARSMVPLIIDHHRLKATIG